MLINETDLKAFGYFDMFQNSPIYENDPVRFYSQFVEDKVFTKGRDRLVENTLGLVGEAGEVSEKVKKLFRDKNKFNDDTHNRIALARALYIAKDEKEKMEVIEKRMIARSKVDKLSERPDGRNESSIMSFKGPDEALNGALIGTKEEIHERLRMLKNNGVGYLLLVDAGGGIEHLRLFAKKIMPTYH